MALRGRGRWRWLSSGPPTGRGSRAPSSAVLGEEVRVLVGGCAVRVHVPAADPGVREGDLFGVVGEGVRSLVQDDRLRFLVDVDRLLAGRVDQAATREELVDALVGVEGVVRAAGRGELPDHGAV